MLINKKNKRINKAVKRILVIPGHLLDISEVSLSTISVSPNPTEGVLHIASPSVALNSITVSDMQGRMIRQSKDVFSNRYTLDISGMSSAVYFINIITDKGNVTKRIIKK